MVNHKKLKDYFNRGMRKLKHRKGFGVHSPFAFSIITEVIEEKLPFYAYRTLQQLYGKQSPISYKVACLLFRLANRFRCRTFIELDCDGGYSMLPLLLTDSRNQVLSVASKQKQEEVHSRLKLLHINKQQYSFTEEICQIEEERKFDMIIVNGNPFSSQNAPESEVNLIKWLLSHSHEESIIFVSGIQANQPLEKIWDMLCDHDEVSITMDLYNNGLAIFKPHFFKQHYIVAF